MEDKKSIIKTEKLCKSFSVGGVQHHIIKNMDLDIYDGDFTVIMGSSGAGKSTLMYALSGMDRASLGKILFCDKDITKFSSDQLAIFRRRHCGFVFQQIHLVSNLTIFENIAVPGYHSKLKSVAEVNELAEELLEKMNIKDIKTHLPAQCSGGEQQRCAIARALINKPELVFADEPTGALNRRNTTEVLDLLTQCNREGQSILMVTHDLRAALRASRILYLEDGKIIGELTLPPYTAEDEKSREKQVSTWLSSMQW